MDEKTKFITEKVCQLFQTYGIKSITMDDIARELGFSKKTLYQYFNDKSDLVKAVVEMEFSKKDAEIEEAMKNQSNAIEAVFGYYRIQMGMLKDHKPSFMFDLRKYYKAVFEELRKRKHEKIIKTMLDNIKRGKKEGLYRNRINEDFISRLHLVRIECIMDSGIFSMEDILSADFFTEFFKYHMYGIVSGKGRKFLNDNFERLFEAYN